MLRVERSHGRAATLRPSAAAFDAGHHVPGNPFISMQQPHSCNCAPHDDQLLPIAHRAHLQRAIMQLDDQLASIGALARRITARQGLKWGLYEPQPCAPDKMHRAAPISHFWQREEREALASTCRPHPWMDETWDRIEEKRDYKCHQHSAILSITH